MSQHPNLLPLPPRQALVQIGERPPRRATLFKLNQAQREAAVTLADELEKRQMLVVFYGSADGNAS